MGLNTTPATWVSGAVVTAAQMNTEVRDAITGVEAVWVSTAPTFAAGVTVGNGTSGQYVRQIGKSVQVRGWFALGSTSSLTASVLLQLPGIAISSNYVIHTALEGVGIYWDNSGAVPYPLGPELVSLTTGGFGSLAFAVPAGGVVNATLPVVFGTSDVLSWAFCYEAA
jgi:hypothetical protein